MNSSTSGTSLSSKDSSGNFDWSQFLQPGETLLWTGRPCYGRKVTELTEGEKTFCIGLAIVDAAMWLTLPSADRDHAFLGLDLVWIYGAISGLLLLMCYDLVTKRSSKFGSLFYAVTNRRALVCLVKNGASSASRGYLVSCHHSTSFAYPVSETLPYPSLTLGYHYLHSRNLDRSFVHEFPRLEWKDLSYSPILPVEFNYIDDLPKVLGLIKENSRGQTTRSRITTELF